MAQDHLHHRLANGIASIAVGALWIAATLTAPASSIESGFARRLGLQMAALENKPAQLVAPTPLSETTDHGRKS